MILHCLTPITPCKAFFIDQRIPHIVHIVLLSCTIDSNTLDCVRVRMSERLV